MKEKLAVTFVRAGIEGYEIGTSEGYVSVPVWHEDYDAVAGILEDACGDVDTVCRDICKLLGAKKAKRKKVNDKSCENIKRVKDALTGAVGERQAADMLDHLRRSPEGVELDNGRLLLYKYVSTDMRSCHGNKDCRIISGNTDSGGHTINELGKEIRMHRDDVNNNPEIACSTGLHVGTKQFVDAAANYGHVILKVAVAPEDVVCVPHNDEGKFRVAAYTPVAVVERKLGFVSQANRIADASAACNAIMDKLLGDSKVQFLHDVMPAFRESPQKTVEALAAAADKFGLEGEVRKKVSSYYYMLPIMQNMPCSV